VLNGKLQPVTAGAGAIEICSRIDTTFLCGGGDLSGAQARHAGATVLAGTNEFGQAHPLLIRVARRRGDGGTFEGAAIRLG